MNDIYKTETEIRTETRNGRMVRVAKPIKRYSSNKTDKDCITTNSRYLANYPDVLTQTECMNILSIGRNAIYSLLQNDVIKSIKIGKLYRIPKSSLENYLNLCYDSGCINSSASV